MWLYGIVLIAEVVDERLRTIVSPGSVTVQGKLVLNNLVTKHVAIVRVVLARKLRHSLQCGIEAHIDSCLAFHTTLGGNQNNAVSTFHTVNGCCRCVLQHRDCSHRRNVNGFDFTLDTINENQRLGINIPRCSATNVNTRVLFTRLTRRSDGCDTREVTREGCTHTTDTGSTLKNLTRGLGNSTHHRGLLLLAVTYYHDLIKLVLLSERHLDVALFANPDFLRDHTNIGEHKRSLLGRNLDFEVTIDVRNSTTTSVSFH